MLLLTIIILLGTLALEVNPPFSAEKIARKKRYKATKATPIVRGQLEVFTEK